MDTWTLAYRDFDVETPGWYLTTSRGDPDAAVASFVEAFPEYDEERARAGLHNEFVE